MDCVFCNCSEKVAENDLAFAVYDRNPVSRGHMLVVPKRHFASFFEATGEEHRAILALLGSCKKALDELYRPDGYNIGVNVGEAAGQTVTHVHVHLIPRYAGDMANPRGGVRGVIPERRIY